MSKLAKKARKLDRLLEHNPQYKMLGKAVKTGYKLGQKIDSGKMKDTLFRSLDTLARGPRNQAPK
jgi:hypothetical protein